MYDQWTGYCLQLSMIHKLFLYYIYTSCYTTRQKAKARYFCKASDKTSRSDHLSQEGCDYYHIVLSLIDNQVDRLEGGTWKDKLKIMNRWKPVKRLKQTIYVSKCKILTCNMTLCLLFCFKNINLWEYSHRYTLYTWCTPYIVWYRT